MKATGLERLLAGIHPPAAANDEDVRAHLDSLTKPPGSLGRLEDVALQLAKILGDPPPRLTRRTVLVLAGDHGVAEHGVSAYPAEVTLQMCRNIAEGGAAISVLAQVVGADVIVADLGVKIAPDHPSVLDCNVRRGTRDLSREAAMTPDEAVKAILVGAALVEERKGALDVVGLGEMGIGNTTAASCICVALAGMPVSQAVGPGTGVSGARKATKQRLVARALKRLPREPEPLTVLGEVGGLEIAGLAGVVLGAARAGIPVVSDGFIATAGALVAVRLCPAARGYLFAAHRSAEPGHTALLEALDARPLLDLDMRLGEGTGAVLAFTILEAAAAILRDMATFSRAGVDGAVDAVEPVERLGATH